MGPHSAPYRRYVTAFVVIPGTVVLFAFLLFSFDPIAGSPNADGKAVYEARCASCHQPNWSGIPGVFPTLHGTRWVVGKPDRLVAIILNGLMGELAVDGLTYNGAMPAWGGLLSDREISAVLTYVRSSWENEAAAISDSTVAMVRSKYSQRSLPWTSDELDSTFGSDADTETDGR